MVHYAVVIVVNRYYYLALPKQSARLRSPTRTSRPIRCARKSPRSIIRRTVFGETSSLTAIRAAASTPVQRLGVVFAHLTQPYQPSPITLSGRPAHRPFRGLLAFTRVAARTLAPSPIRDQLHRRLQPFRHLHDCSGCFRLERSPGGTCTHGKAPPWPAHTSSGRCGSRR